MAYDPEKHRRRSMRLKGYDYARAGAYFVTICVQGRLQLFGNIADGRLRPNDAGRMVARQWMALARSFPFVQPDAHVVMPNHLHGIVIIRGVDGASSRVCARSGLLGDHKDRGSDRPHGTVSGTLGRVIQAFKSLTTRDYITGVKQRGWAAFEGKLWQRSYYDHIIRDEEELRRLRTYIEDNPQRWAEDHLHPSNLADW
jgi:REP element-mobilizing transposase RayT